MTQSCAEKVTYRHMSSCSLVSTCRAFQQDEARVYVAHQTYYLDKLKVSYHGLDVYLSNKQIAFRSCTTAGTFARMT